MAGPKRASELTDLRRSWTEARRERGAEVQQAARIC